jgi:cytochrome c oxidase cbb3-type subunit 3
MRLRRDRRRPGDTAMSEHRIDPETGVETTGHSWDGIEELNNPLPRWWLWTFYATCVWGLLYTIAYPAWPLVSGATQGLLGYSTRAEVARDIEAFEISNAELRASLVEVDLAVLPANEALHSYAVQAGASVFRNHCSQCHGSGAAGGLGYPNLLDDEWLWGGTLEDIAYTVRHGIRNEDDPDARWTEMPAFGEWMSEEELASVVSHVQSISGGEPARPDLLDLGGQLYLDNCAACHGDEGRGDRTQGAPNLTDAIWLYGGDAESLTESISYGPFGVMPPWAERLGEAQVRAVTAYVHQLGGGEEAPAGDRPAD